MSERRRSIRVLSAWRDGDRSDEVVQGALRALNRYGLGSGLPFEDDVLNPYRWVPRGDNLPDVGSSLYRYNLESGCYAFFALTRRPTPMLRGIALRTNSMWSRLYVDVLGFDTVNYGFSSYGYLNPRADIRQKMLRKGAREYYVDTRARLERGWMATYMEHEVAQLLTDLERGTL